MNRTSAQVQASSAAVTLPGKHTDYKIERIAGFVQITHNTTAVVTRVGSNARVRFDDFTYAMDIDGSAGMAYRIYKAAFARTPDVRGLSYWIEVMDKGSTLKTIAQEFVKSSEYRQVYGINPTDGDVIRRYYRNVLGREGDNDGIWYWEAVLRNRQSTVAEVLAGFSESAENQDSVYTTISTGIAYRETGVSYVAVANAGPSLTTIAGTPVTLDGSNSLGRTTDALTYTWTLTERPAGSVAALLNPHTAFPTITPDKEGVYKFSLVVNDGLTRATATTDLSVVQAPLSFAPTDARYSHGLDKVITISTNPNLLSIVDPFSGSVRSVSLPAAVKNFSLSPDGKLAIVLYESVASLVDLETATLAKSFATGGKHTDAFVTDKAIAYFIGQTGGQWVDSGVMYFNARSGENISKAVPNSIGRFYGTQYGIYASLKNQVFFMSQGLSPSDIDYFTIDPATNHITETGESPYHGDYPMNTPFFLSEYQDLLFTSNGNIFNTSNLRYAGVLAMPPGESIISLSNSTTKGETLVLGAKHEWYPASTTLSSRYHVFNSALFFAGGSVELPRIAGKQTYGMRIWHSPRGRRIVLVQHGSALQQAAGVKYFVLAL